jgi:hypothetical protein
VATVPGARALTALLLALLLVVPVASCRQPEDIPPLPTTPSVTQPLSLLDALHVLLGEVLPPASSSARVSAYMPSEPLKAGDVVSSESGYSYLVEDDTWFAFIDDAPEAFFAHACRYVFIDAGTGAYELIPESWPPDINDSSMWDQPGANWHLVEVLSVLDCPVPAPAAASTAPRGDYGDAPDGTEAYHGVAGRYPTRYATSYGFEGRPGCHTLVTGEETIGRAVSAEVDVTDPNDPDGVPNLVDADSDERAFVIIDGSTSRIAITVSVAPVAPDVVRYLNVLIDFDQSGTWGPGARGPEWPVKNLAVSVAPGRSETIITPAFSWGTGSVSMSPVWMRALFSREQVNESAYSGRGGWDGSGSFERGEVEDYLVFLMEKPPVPQQVRWPPAPGQPPGGDGQQNGGGAPPPPGPEKGPCGYDVKNHVIVINCGDNEKDLSKGTPIVKASSDSVSGAAHDQGYNEVANLSPGGAGDSKASIANIGKAFDQLAANVKCGDRVLIYICGHGLKDGGIAIKNASGRTQEVMKPTDSGGKDDGKDNSLEDFLNKIPACPDEDCEKPGCCCDVTVILESCFAGNFKVDGVTGQGRTVVGTSTNTEAWAAYPGGGAYTRGLVEGMRDPAVDTDDPPNGVEPLEAHENGKKAISDSNRARGKAQQPWEDGRKCDCKCPCQPDIDVDKWVMGGDVARWVDRVEVEPGSTVRFRIEIENTGKCRDLVDLQFIDEMAGCLQYAGDATIDTGGAATRRNPDEVWQSAGGSIFIWDLSDVGPLSPGDIIGIEYDAIAREPGPNFNKGTANAHCSVDYSVIVVDADMAVALVQGEEGPPPLPEEALEVNLELHAVSQTDGVTCWSTVTVSASARDLSGGSYPVKAVSVTLHGAPWFNSGSVSTPFYSKTLQLEAGCGQPLLFEVIATNSLGMHATTAGDIITPVP